jgi:tRNA(Glu) U13 pseudouridine synthase TruD
MTKFGCERAVMSIPHQSRVMFAHSFTSLLWNHLASYRIQEYGNRPVVGDLVMSDAAKNIRWVWHSIIYDHAHMTVRGSAL